MDDKQGSDAPSQGPARSRETGSSEALPHLNRAAIETKGGAVVEGDALGGDNSLNNWGTMGDVTHNTYIDKRRTSIYIAQLSGSTISTTLPERVRNVPYNRNPHFTGRDELLDQLDRRLSPQVQEHETPMHRAALTQPRAIKGLGGIGKTQIAVEYAYRSWERNRYFHIFWVNAADEKALLTSFTDLASILPAFSASKKADQRKLVAAIKRWLESCQQPWLLIFDNADDVDLVSDFLPHQGNGSVLLTTRSDAVGSIAEPIEVEKMGLMEGSCLLLRRAYGLTAVPDEEVFEHVADEQVDEAGNIVVALDALPLALDQAGAYIEETKCGLADYLKMYEGHSRELHAKRGQQSTNYPASVATTWSLSFQKVEQANPAAAELLHLCSFLAPDRIPEELVKDGAAYWPPLLKRAATDLFDFNTMIAALLKFSLVKRLIDEHMLTIHRLVQAVQMDMMEPEAQLQWAERVIRSVNHVFPRDPHDVAVWPQCLRYLDQAQECQVLIERHGFAFVEAGDVLSRTGSYLFDHGLYTLVEPLYQQALHIQEQALGPEHPDVSHTLNELAILYRGQSKYEEAKSFYQRALHIREKALGPEDPSVAKALNGLANTYKAQTKYAEAEPLYQRALGIQEKALGPEHPYVAISLSNLAELYQIQGRYEQAESHYQKALHIQEKALGFKHPDLVYPLENLACLYTLLGKFVEAEPLHLRALHIREEMLGSDHPLVADTLIGLANLYTTQQKYDEAEPLYLRALHIQEKALGSEHLDVGISLSNLAYLYYKREQYEQAESLCRRALQIEEHILGPEHPNLASAIATLANIYYDQEQYEQAEPLYRRALHIREMALGHEHFLVSVLFTQLADLYYSQEKYEEAEPLYRKSLHILERVLGPEHPDVASTLNDLAFVMYSQEKYEEAEPLFQRALDMRQHLLGPQHPDTVETQAQYATLLRALDRPDEAILLEAALSEQTSAE